jgi:hypothetical protein
MRWRNSVALPSDEKLKFDANCSAAEGILHSLNPAGLGNVMGAGAGAPLYRYQTALRAALFSAASLRRVWRFPGSPFLFVVTFFLKVSVTVPPAFSTASFADFEAPATVMSILDLIAPSPSRRMPSLLRLARPAFRMAAGSIF